MNAAHTAATASLGAPAIAQILIYLTTWPLRPLDPGTALSIAGVICAIGAAYGISWLGGPANPPAPPPAPNP